MLSVLINFLMAISVLYVVSEFIEWLIRKFMKRK